MKYFFLTVALLCATVLVLLAYLILSGLGASYKTLRALAQLKCPQCGTAYGGAAARRSERRYSVQCRAALQSAEAKLNDGDGILISFSNQWPIECAVCGRREKFDAVGKTFALDSE